MPPLKIGGIFICERTNMPITFAPLNAIFTFLEKHWAQCTVVFLITITYLSLTPSGPQGPIDYADKIYHCIAYAGLALPMALRKPTYWVGGMLGLVVFGGIIEVVQPYTGRSADWLDFIMNSVGVLIAVLISRVIPQPTPQVTLKD